MKPDAPMVLRTATEADVPAITRLLNALLGTTTYEWTEVLYSAHERSEWLHAKERAANPVIVAEDQGGVVGWATYGDFRDSGRWPGYRFTIEHTIHVAQTHWGRGIGRALLVELAEVARSAGKRVMVAAIDSTNVGSIDFHARLGFDIVGRMPGVGEKWGQRCDLVLMQRELDGPLS